MASIDSLTATNFSEIPVQLVVFNNENRVIWLSEVLGPRNGASEIKPPRINQKIGYITAKPLGKCLISKKEVESLSQEAQESIRKHCTLQGDCYYKESFMHSISDDSQAMNFRIVIPDSDNTRNCIGVDSTGRLQVNVTGSDDYVEKAHMLRVTVSKLAQRQRSLTAIIRGTQDNADSGKRRAGTVVPNADVVSINSGELLTMSEEAYTREMSDHPTIAFLHQSEESSPNLGFSVAPGFSEINGPVTLTQNWTEIAQPQATSTPFDLELHPDDSISNLSREHDDDDAVSVVSSVTVTSAHSSLATNLLANLNVCDSEVIQMSRSIVIGNKKYDRYQLANQVNPNRYDGYLIPKHSRHRVEPVLIEKLLDERRFSDVQDILKRTAHRFILEAIEYYSNHTKNDYVIFYQYFQYTVESLSEFNNMENSESTERGFSDRFSLRMLRDVLEALQYLHESCRYTVIHGSVTPSNVFLTDVDGATVAMLGGFGRARVQGCSVHDDEMDLFCDVFEPPESVQMRTTRSDVYQAGLLLYFMLIGQRPANDGVGSHQSDLCIDTLTSRGVSGDIIALFRSMTSELDTRITSREALEDLGKLLR